MGQVLHGTGTPIVAVHRAIQRRQASLRSLAERYGITQTTKWSNPFCRRSPDGTERAKSTVRCEIFEARILDAVTRVLGRRAGSP